MEFSAVNEYIMRLAFNDRYTDMDETMRESVVFTASEMLGDEFGAERLTPRAVALQVLYMLEGEAEEFGKLKRHGVKSYSVKGVSVTFDTGDISPAVLRILQPTAAGSAGVGRIV